MELKPPQFSEFTAEETKTAGKVAKVQGTFAMDAIDHEARAAGLFFLNAALFANYGEGTFAADVNADMTSGNFAFHIKRDDDGASDARF